MMKLLLAAFCVLVFAQASFVPEGYTLVFADEFDAVGLDRAAWDYRYLGEYQAGWNSEEAVVQIGDGLLQLVTTRQGERTLTGMIRSSAEWQYGYFEARIQFQALQGHHGAFWLQSPRYNDYLNDPAQSGAEIDIAEYFGGGREREFQHNVYWNPYDSPELQRIGWTISYRRLSGQEMSADFHVFGLLWTPSEYVFTVDGVETGRTTAGVSQTPEYIVLSLITSAWEAERLPADQLPDAMLIDYVRVYQQP